jgi:hypothetical protein
MKAQNVVESYEHNVELKKKKTDTKQYIFYESNVQKQTKLFYSPRHQNSGFLMQGRGG